MPGVLDRAPSGPRELTVGISSQSAFGDDRLVAFNIHGGSFYSMEIGKRYTGSFSLVPAELVSERLPGRHQLQPSCFSFWTCLIHAGQMLSAAELKPGVTPQPPFLQQTLVPLVPLIYLPGSPLVTATITTGMLTANIRWC